MKPWQILSILGMVGCFSLPVHADPFGVLGTAGSLLDTVEQHQWSQENIKDRALQRKIEAERHERDSMRFEMERQRFEMEMLERKKALGTPPPMSPTPVRQSAQETPATAREARAAERAAQRFQQEQAREQPSASSRTASELPDTSEASTHTPKWAPLAIPAGR